MPERTKYAVLFFLLVFLLNAVGPAQTSFDNPQIINKKSGLPNDVVNAILKDDLGFIWLATNGGLCRWDGISVKTFTHDPADSTSLPGNVIPSNAFVIDTLSKQIILATENGLSFFDPLTLIFKNLISDNDENADLHHINSILVDRQGDIWLGTRTGMVRFDRNDFSFTGYEIPETFNGKKITDKLQVRNIFDIKQDVNNDSILWMATLKGLLKFNKYSTRFSHFCFDNRKMKNTLNTFNKVIAHSNRKLYLGTWNADMVVFNTVNEKFEYSYGPYSTTAEYVTNSPVIPNLQKSENELWVSSMNGAGIFNAETHRINYIRSFVNSGGRPYTPFIDLVDGNSIWLSSEYGVIRMRLSNGNFENHFFPPVDKDHWFLTTSFYEDTLRQRLYIGYARGQGLHYFDLKDKTFHHLPFPKRMLKEYNVRKFLPLDQNEVLFLTPEDIYNLSLNDGKITPLHVPYDEYPVFTDLTMDNKNRIWVSGMIEGLYQLDIPNDELRVVEKVKRFFESRTLQPKVKKITTDKYGRVWFTSDGNYGVYDPDADTLHFFKNDTARFILSFYKDDPDTIWVTMSRYGLGYILPVKPQKGIRSYAGIRKSISGVRRDDSGNFYMLTPSGIEKLVPGQSQTVVFSENEGLVKYSKWENRDPTMPGKLYKLSDGRMVIGYRRGLGFFFPDSLHKAKEEFRPYISALKISGKEYPLGETLNFSKEIVLNHTRNSLTFDYSALAPENGKDIRFYHRLSDVDRGWVASNNRSVNYSGLRPGHYRFKVKAESTSSPGMVRETTLGFVIRPPWWSTWWAVALYLLGFVSILYSIYRYQLSRVLAQKEAERLREVDKLKSRLYANITHEFRTPLTVIRGMADEMIGSMNVREQKRFSEKLEMIERNSDKLLHLVQQMLDMSKIEDGKMKLNLIRDNIVSYLQYVLESFQSMADSKNVKLVFYHETDRIIMDYDQDKIFVIASNLLSNAIKFTPMGGKVIFHVKKEKQHEKDYLIIKVQDSGIGIKEEHLDRIFDRFYQVDNSEARKNEGTGIGLALTKELVELMKGQIIVKSTPGEITEFCVSIPVTTNAPLQKAKPIVTRREGKHLTAIEVVSDTGDKNLPLALVVEDNPDVARYIISCLAGRYCVKWSPDGEQGIATAIEVIPDIIISDVMMPGKDGFEVCEILKNDERTSHIPVILLTAKATEKDRIEGLSHGADAYLTKPFNKKELFVRLEQLIKIRKQLQKKYSKVDIGITRKALPTGEERFLKKAVEVIEKHLDDPKLNATLLAESLNMSESQLYRKLKALGRKSTALFIRGIRLSAARRLLEESDMNISQVAYACGFNDPAWFSRVFKEEFGVPPSEMRK